MKLSTRNASSFRDPSGFLFMRGNRLYRQVNRCYRADYDHLMTSGLYEALAGTGSLIPHQETGIAPSAPQDSYKVIQPDLIDFISYPYEWCFSELKDAALLTLQIQKRALEFGMMLKDASAYNIQFKGGKPVLIDTLSFERSDGTEPWVAYRQFCQHFLGPLALMHYTDIRLNHLLRIHLDGIPLDLCSKLLPLRSRLHVSLFLHIHAHARSQKHFEDKGLAVRGKRMPRIALLGILDQLESLVKKLIWKPKGTEWAEYYQHTNYSVEAMSVKQRIVGDFLKKTQPQSVWDLGANDGMFSRLSSQLGISTVAFDVDPAAVERNYLDIKRREDHHLQPLVMDLTNPSPGIGWQHQERMSFMKRSPADLVMALALIHHLAISNNLPLGHIADFFHRLASVLIIEFVPKEDSQVKKLLLNREDMFPDYTVEAFEQEFGAFFTIEDKVLVTKTSRTLYLMQSK